jgi:hypothetical protein
VSVEAMAWVLHRCTAGGTDKLVLLGIATHADELGRNAWPSVSTLARYASVSERSVQSALRRLNRDGWLDIEVNAGGLSDMRKDRRPNRYTVNMDGVIAASPRSERGEESRSHGVKLASPKPSKNHPLVTSPNNGDSVPAPVVELREVKRRLKGA